MIFQKIHIGDVMGRPIHHCIVHLDFEDYDNFFLKTRGEKPVRVDVYTASQEKGRDFMLGFDFLWSDGRTERMSFKDFWDEFDHKWDWGDNKVVLRSNTDNPYSVLSLDYTEVVFQTHSSGCCAFDRLYNRVTGFTKDVEAMKRSVKKFEEEAQEMIHSFRWR